MIFDTHAHYDDEKYNEDREALLASLVGNGVGALVNVASSLSSVKTTLNLSNKYPFIYAALGIHPDSIHELDDEKIEEIRQILNETRYKSGLFDKKTVAVGEIGLDYYYDDANPRELQKEWFVRQIQLAKEEKFPIIVHSRDAAKDTYDILKETYREDGAGVMHCFSYPKEMARQFLDIGYYIGIGGVVTFKNGKNAKEVAQYVPLDRLLLETDCPYMAPVPQRGTRNDSTLLKYVVKEIAGLRGISEEKLIQATEENAKRFYRIN